YLHFHGGRYILSKVASNMTENLWQSVIEVLRKVMDFVTARNLVIERSPCQGFVANLQNIFHIWAEVISPPTLAPKETRTDSKPRASHGRYRPPHLRNKDGGENDSLEGRNSDSEYSRISAVHDPKLLTSQWPVLLPENDVLQQSFEDQKYDANFGPSGPKEESSIKERCLVAGIKVMDECLRVSSGFKGADDIKECRLLDIQQISDCTINKTIKSAPHFEMEAAGSSQNCSLDITLELAVGSSSSLPGKFIDAIEFNTHNSSTPHPYQIVSFSHKEYRDNWRSMFIVKQVKSNAVRALGYLSRFIRFNYQAATINDPSDSVFMEIRVAQRMVQALVSCVTTGNVKVQWNVCHALSNLFMNDTLRLQDMPWASSVYSILLLLIRDSNNYKIKMHAAVALAVPVSRLDVVRGLVHALESLNSNNSSLPSNFKQKDNLEKQLAFTALHLLSFVSPNDDPSLKDFLTKKASFLEDWLKSLCTSFNNEHQPLPTEAINDEDGFSPNVTQKVMLSSALQSLLGIYTGRNQQVITQRFEQLARSIA
ncbi:unnamed protein product, partial [Miscanthus lutarioriparius]